MGLYDIHEINAVKTLLAAVINGTSVLVFVATGNMKLACAGDGRIGLGRRLRYAATQHAALIAEPCGPWSWR